MSFPSSLFSSACRLSCSLAYLLYVRVTAFSKDYNTFIQKLVFEIEALRKFWLGKAMGTMI
jgi:hypothetical protein